jgi:hypothetical protein
VDTCRAFDPGLVTHTGRPLIGTRRRVAGFPRAATLKPSGIDIVATAEELSKQRDLGFRKRQSIDMQTQLFHAMPPRQKSSVWNHPQRYFKKVPVSTPI